MVEHMASVQ
uniref:Uncharacterized protein n=1 Tax=Arundo donax TaxID=35708 RepID=A0A0A9CE57_ARUDO